MNINTKTRMVDVEMNEWFFYLEQAEAMHSTPKNSEKVPGRQSSTDSHLSIDTGGLHDEHIQSAAGVVNARVRLSLACSRCGGTRPVGCAVCTWREVQQNSSSDASIYRSWRYRYYIGSISIIEWWCQMDYVGLYSVFSKPWLRYVWLYIMAWQIRLSVCLSSVTCVHSTQRG